MSEQLPPLISHDSLRIITAAAQVRARHASVPGFQPPELCFVGSTAVKSMLLLPPCGSSSWRYQTRPSRWAICSVQGFPLFACGSVACTAAERVNVSSPRQHQSGCAAHAVSLLEFEFELMCIYTARSTSKLTRRWITQSQHRLAALCNGDSLSLRWPLFNPLSVSCIPNTSRPLQQLLSAEHACGSTGCEKRLLDY